MNRDQKLREKLPDHLKDDPFWKNSFIKRPTTFGCEARAFREVVEDDPYRVEKDLQSWQSLDEHRVNHGRLQITSTWGSLKHAPPSSAKYDPQHDKRSKMESFPSLTISTKPIDNEFEDTLEYNKTFRTMFPIQSSPQSMQTSRKKRPKSSHKLNTGGNLRNLNVDDMKKGKSSFD